MIAIDGFSLLFLPGGIKSYLIAILKALNDSTEAQNNKYVILLPVIDESLGAFYPREAKELEKSLGDNFSFHKIKIHPLLPISYNALHVSHAFMRRYTLFLWEHYYLPRAVKKLKPGVVFHPYQAVSNYQTPARKVVVIHDIFHWVENQQYTPLVKFLYNTFKNGCINADVIITISKTSQNEIVDYLKVDEKKVAMCYEGVDDIFVKFKPTEKRAGEIKADYHLPDKYLFVLESVRAYKNVRGVLETFNLLHKDDPDLRLVLLGWALSSDAALQSYLKEKQLEDAVVQITHVEHLEDLAYLYHLSFVYLFLSKKEGFGLPPLEAVASGTLAITSNVSALGEIYNGVLPTFGPTDYSEIAAYIRGLTPEKKKRALESAAEKLLPRFTWKEVLPHYLKYIS